MQAITIEHEGYIITTDKSLLKPEQIHLWLSTEAYWSKNIPYSLVKQAFDHSFCIGILKGEKQIGYARLVTDYASFGYLADVYILEEHRGKGLSKKMLSVIMELEWVKGLRRIMLATLDAHELYKQMGFVGTAFPERFMEINRPAIYESTTSSLS
jgi:GNAT superfamily N-acetyltransferase